MCDGELDREREDVDIKSLLRKKKRTKTKIEKGDVEDMEKIDETRKGGRKQYDAENKGKKK